MLAGTILARRRRRLAGWVLTAGLSGEYRHCYTTFSAVFESLTEGFVHLVPEEFAPVGNPAEQVIKTGNDQNPDYSAHEHSADTGGADGPVTDGPGAGGKDQRKEAGDERKGSHLN